MPSLLVVHPSRSGLEREARAAELAELAELEIAIADDQVGLASLERALARADALALVEPARWWPRSVEDRLRRPWLIDIERHVAFDRANALASVACVARAVPRSEALAGLTWLPTLAGVREWLPSLAPPRAALQFTSAFEGEPISRPASLDALDSALAGTPRVALVGPLGSGKTSLVREWLARPALPKRVVAHHFALPEHRATQRAAWIAASLARQLDREASSLAEALDRVAQAQPSAWVVLVVDGLERVDDPAALLAAIPPHHEGRVHWLFGARPGPLPANTTALALAAESTLIEALVGQVARLDPGDRVGLVDRAGNLPSYVAAMIDESASRTSKSELRAMSQNQPADEGELARLPRRFEAELARALGHVAALPIATRRAVERLLELLARVGEPLPISIVRACEIGRASRSASVSIEALVGHARGLVADDTTGVEARLALAHPSLAELLRAQLDDRSALELRLLAGLERAQASSQDPHVHELARRWRTELQHVRAATLSEALSDVAKLVEQARREGLGALEQAFEIYGGGEGLGADVLAVLRSSHAELTRELGDLPGTLWNGLVARGWMPGQLLALLRWPQGEPPSVRLERALDQADGCWRSLPHPGEVHACAISSDGERIVTGCDDGRLRLWSRAKGEVLVEMVAGGLVRACAMTPDGRWAVSGNSSGTIDRWELATGRRADTHTVQGDCVVGLAFDASGSVVLVGFDDGKVWVWRAGSAPRKLGSHGERIVSVAITRDGRLGISGGGRQVFVWDLETGSRVGASSKYEYMVGALALAPDEKRVFVTAIGESRVLALPSAETEITHAHKVPHASCCVALDQADRVLLGHEGRLERWDMKLATLEASAWAHTCDIEACAVSAGARWWVSAGGPEAKIWTSEASQPEAPGKPSRWTGQRTCVAASPSGQVVLVAGDYKLVIVEVETGEPRGVIEVGARINAIAWIDDDRFVTIGATSREVAVWSLARRERIVARELSSDWLRGVAIHPDRRRALVVGDEKRTWLLDLDDLDERVLGRHPDWANACAFDREGKRALAVDGDAELRIWDLESGSLELQGKSGTNYTYAALACVGELAFAGGNATLDVWDLERGKLGAGVAAHRDKITALAIADEGRVLVSASEDGRIKLWRVAKEPTLLATVVGHAPFTGLSVTGSRLLATDEAGNLWHLRVDWHRLG